MPPRGSEGSNARRQHGPRVGGAGRAAGAGRGGRTANDAKSPARQDAARHDKGRTDSSRQDAARNDSGRRAKPPRRADPRRTAYDVLAAVHERDAYANLLLPRLLAERGLAGRDAALATELTYGTLRGQGSYDAVLAACSDRPLAKLDPPVLLVLRLGTHQLLSTRVGAHAAVATSVDLAKSVAGPRVSGYVNAVLRRVATRDLDAWLAIIAPSTAADPDGHLAIRYSHPRWVVDAYRAALGDTADAPFTAQQPTGDRHAPADDPAAGDADGKPAESAAAATPGARNAEAQTSEAQAAAPAGREITELEAALAAGNARPRVTLATFPAGPDRDQVMPEGAAPGRWSRYAFTLASGDPAPLTAGGRAAVQDEGSQLAAIALSLAPVTSRLDATGEAPGDVPGEAGEAGECWLDLCAGPGGKSRLLYGLAAERGARLVAAELHPHRAALVRQALAGASTAATGPLPGFAVLATDGTRPPWQGAGFDRVLADVPCSGLGALRRRPEARWRKSPADLPALARLQRGLLAAALAAVRPGGVVAYVTCSPVPQETTDVVAAAAGEGSNVIILDTPAVLSRVPGVRSSGSQFAQLWPHRHGTDAIFIALLRRGTE
jgi:16S rRNA (cytosine967-C5)-methyltransferase